MNELQSGIVWLAGICVALTGIWAFIEKVRKPYRDVIARLAALEDHAEDHERESIALINKNGEMLQHQEEVNERLMKATSLLMKHCADNNHTGELTRMANDLDDFILHKGSSL